MNDQDQINEEERQEAATETPAFLGCPQHMPTHLPGGFDGVEPAPKKRSDLEKMNDLLRNRLRKISDVADKAVMGIRTDEEHNIALLGACTEIRQLVDFYKPREKPVDPTAPEMKAAKQKEYFRKHFSFCDGLFPIRFTNTEDGQMASCWINGRHFTLDIDNNERDDGGNDCAANIRDNGKVVITIETQRGKSISGKVAYGAFKEYVRNLSGSGRCSSRGGFLKQAAKRAMAAKKGGAK